MKKILDSLGQLLFPKLCVCCDGYLTHQDGSICDFCTLNLPKFELFKLDDNPLAKKFWGRINVEFATGYLNFSGGNEVRKIMHEVKYRSNKTLGKEMGEALGRCLKETNRFTDIDYIIPVPLHPKREHIRGYNQSDLLVDGTSSIIAGNVLKNALIRTRNTHSQTKKKRYERFINAKEVFRVERPSVLEGKHVLLIDDVITTGSTIEACGDALLQVDNLRLSVASLAVAI